MASSTYAWDLPSAHVTFDVSSSSDKGLVRRINEDSFVAAPPLFLVADGMGGHAFGDRASQETARVLEAGLPADGPTTASAVLVAVKDANSAVRSISEDEFAGSTLAGVALVQDDSGEMLSWMAFNIGDSRVYSWSGDILSQLSVDHSAVQELVDEGIITQAEAAVHPDRNVITRAIGIEGDLEPDVWLLPTGGEHTFVICSDGLTKELDDATIGEVLRHSGSLLSPADRLVAAALAAGGGDNVTVVVVSATISLVPVPGSDSDEPSLPAHLEETLPRA